MIARITAWASVAAVVVTIVGGLYKATTVLADISEATRIILAQNDILTGFSQEAGSVEDLDGTWEVSFRRGAVGRLSLAFIDEKRFQFAGEGSGTDEVSVAGTGHVAGQTLVLPYVAETKDGSVKWSGTLYLIRHTNTSMSGWYKNEHGDYQDLIATRLN